MKNLFIVWAIFIIGMHIHGAEKLKLPVLSAGKQIQLAASIFLPKGQKLNKGAPSNITISEKVGLEWQEVEKINLNDYFTLTESFNVNKKLQLNLKKSILKIRASLYHCDKIKNNYCVIDDFDGEIKRNISSKNTTLNIDLKGSLPR